MKIRTPIRPLHVREKSYLPHILAIACLWTLAMSLDYATEAGAAEEAAAQAIESKENWQAQMIACLNGTYRASTPSGIQIACMKAETFNPKNRSKS